MTALRYECALAADVPKRAARVAVLERLRSPAAFGPLVVLVALAVVFFATGVAWLGAGIAVAVVISLVAIPFRIPRLAVQLAARGMGPGSTITVEFDDAAFTVLTPRGTGVHRYADVRSLRVRHGIVAIRLARAGFLVLLPEQLVPGEARRLLDRGGPGHA